VQVSRVSHSDGIILFRVPFWLPPPSPDNVPWLTSLSEQRDLRKAFGIRLQAELQRFVPAVLQEFLLERLDIKDACIQEKIKRYLQKRLAGRPAYDQPPLSPREKEILSQLRISVEAFRDTVEQLSAQSPTDREIRAHLRESVDSTEKAHMEKYLKLFLRHFSEGVPRRPYERSGNGSIQNSNMAKLSEPREWNVVAIAATLTFHEIRITTGKRYSKKVLEEALRRKRNRSKQLAKNPGN